MRAPAPSFKRELAACRQRLESELKDRTKLAFARKVLDRWARQDAIEDIWATVHSKLRVEYSAEDFILDVLASGHQAKKCKSIVYELDSLRGLKVLDHNKRFIKQKRYSDAALEMKLFAELREERRRLLSREKKTAARTYFMGGWRGKFIALCGQPLNDIVADLTYIALGDAVATEQVRATQKRTTRRGRQSRDRDTRPPK